MTIVNVLPTFQKVKNYTSVGVEPTNAACAPSTAHINISTSVGVEPTNAAWAPSTAKNQVAYITTPDAAVHSVYGFYINYFSVQNYDISLICSSEKNQVAYIKLQLMTGLDVSRKIVNKKLYFPLKFCVFQ